MPAKDDKAYFAFAAGRQIAICVVQVRQDLHGVQTPVRMKASSLLPQVSGGESTGDEIADEDGGNSTGQWNCRPAIAIWSNGASTVYSIHIMKKIDAELGFVHLQKPILASGNYRRCQVRLHDGGWCDHAPSIWTCLMHKRQKVLAAAAGPDADRATAPSELCFFTKSGFGKSGVCAVAGGLGVKKTSRFMRDLALSEEGSSGTRRRQGRKE